MAIVYVTTGAWGAGKGSPATAAEVDGNFWDHEQRIDVLEAAPSSARSIDHISESNGLITIHYTDATTDGPFPLPTADLVGRGEWANSTNYFRNEIVTVTGTGAFLVLQDHTTAASPAVFDPNATIGGNPVYSILFPYPSPQQVFSPPVTVAGTTFTPTLSQAGSYFRCTAASCNITIPPNSTTAYAIGTELHFRGVGGALTFTPGAGVTINPPRAGHAYASYVGAAFTLKKIATNEWDATGPHGAAL